MLEVIRAAPARWKVARQVRLAALRDAPYAFAESYDEAALLSEDDWKQRLDRWVMFLAIVAGSGPATASLVATDTNIHTDAIAGIVAVLPSSTEVDAGSHELIAMWVNPEHRGSGAGSALVNAVVDWAGSDGALAVSLWVGEHNQRARRFYERNGFSPTGKVAPPCGAETGAIMEMSRATQNAAS